MTRLFGSMVIAFMLAFTISAADKDKSEKTLDEKRSKLDTALAEMTRMLEAKEYKALIETFATPDTLKEITKSQSVDKVAEEFGKDKAEKLLTVLKSIKDAKPTMSEKDTKATYELKEEIGGKKEISFVLIDKFWYIDGK